MVVEGYEATDGAALPAGSAQPIVASLPESVADLPLSEEGLTGRGVRFLPLSGKEDGALRDLARQYSSWLDEHADADTAEAVLADMAWTAGVGRSHFGYRAGVVFGDVASLRDGLKTLAEVEERPQPMAATKVAFAYTGEGSQWVGMGQALYECEPVVRGGSRPLRRDTAGRTGARRCWM